MEYYDYHWWDAQLMHSMGKEQGSALEHSFSMSSWAANEVAIAKKKEQGDSEDGGFNYGGACFDSALKAFNSLCGDGHSGMSIGFTRGILNRLFLGKPLTPIEDVPEVWSSVTVPNWKTDIKETYQCNRMTSFFKDVMVDGSIRFHDINRTVSIDMRNSSSWTNGLVSKMVDDMFPIIMPYYPSADQYVVYCEEWLDDPSNGDYDTLGMQYMIKPDGTRLDINKFYKESGSSDNPWTEIDQAEYESRKAVAIARQAKEDML